MDPREERKEYKSPQEESKRDTNKKNWGNKPSRINDGAWYTQNGAVDLIGTNLGNKTGKNVAITYLSTKVPTVTRVEIAVTLPRTRDDANGEWIDAVKNMYIDIRAVNAGRPPYSAVDLEKYIINTRAYYIVLEHMIRLVKASNTDNVYKKDFRPSLLKALGLSAVDITTYADQWATFKSMILQELKTEPENYPVIGALYERDRFLYENAFKMEKGHKASTFVFVPRQIPYYTYATGMEVMDLEADDLDALIAKYWAVKAELKNCPNMDEIVKEMRKATGMYTIMQFDKGFVDAKIDEVFNLAFAEQFQNAFMVKPNLNNAVSVAFDTLNGFVNESFSIQAKFDDADGDGIENCQCFNNNVLITTQFDKLSGVDIIERTRFKCGGTTGGSFYFITTRGTELILNLRFYYSGDFDYVFNNITYGALNRLSSQEHMPYVYKWVTRAVYATIYDLDQYGFVNIIDLANYHNIATASLLKATKLRAVELINSYLHRNQGK